MKRKNASGQDIIHSPEPFIDTFVSIGVSMQRTSDTRARKDFTRSILRRNKDLYHRLRSLIESDTLSSNETDMIMRLLTDEGKFSRYFRLIADPSTPISSLKDWRKHERGVRGLQRRSSPGRALTELYCESDYTKGTSWRNQPIDSFCWPPLLLPRTAVSGGTSSRSEFLCRKHVWS